MSMALLAFPPPTPAVTLLPLTVGYACKKFFRFSAEQSAKRAAGIQRADWQRTCGRAAICCLPGEQWREREGEGEIVVPGVNYKDKA